LGETLKCGGLRIAAGVLEDLDLMEYPCTDLSIEGCEIKLLTFPEFQETGLRIQDCIIERVSGLTAS